MDDLNPAAGPTTPWRWVALGAGPLLAVAGWWLTGDTALDEPGRRTIGMMIWMAVWWMTEATDLTVTSLLPLVAFPLLGISPEAETASNYADPVIFLFMGSFLLALGIQRWGLGERLSLLTLRLFGTGQRAIVGGMMLVSGVFSMFLSNTATVAMLLPVAACIVAISDNSVSGESESGRASGRTGFASCLMLSIAYASSIGGIATIIGTPPNTFLISFLNRQTPPVSISFEKWLFWGLPFSASFLAVAWFLMVRVILPVPNSPLPGGRAMIEERLRRLGRVARGEWLTLGIFLLTVVLWLTRGLLVRWTVPWDGLEWHPLAGLTDTSIVLGTAVLLFLIPCRHPVEGPGQLMNWNTARHLPWNVLLLFGGGLALADAVRKNAVAEYLGSLLNGLAGLPDLVVILLVVTLVVFLTELTSNIATTTSVLPVLAGLSLQLEMPVALLAVPATMAASCAFMLPVATAPNAIVFGTGRIEMGQMIRAGLWLNFVSVILITLVTCTLMRWSLGI